MDLKDFKMTNLELCALQELCRMVKQDYKVKDYKLRELMDTVKDYCISKKEKTMEQYIKYLLRSKLLRPFNIQYEDLLKEAQKVIDEFDKMIKELAESEKNNNQFYIIKDVGKKRFKKWLITKNLTMDQFAKLCGCSTQYISMVINGKKHITKRQENYSKKVVTDAYKK